MNEAWLVVEEGISDGGIFGIKQQVMTLGRGPANPIQIVDKSVSRRHARIQYIADQYVISDLSSRNGTWVNGIAVEEMTPLHNGDLIQVGDIIMLFLLGKCPSDQPDMVRAWKKASDTTRITRTGAMRAAEIQEVTLDQFPKFPPRTDD